MDLFYFEENSLSFFCPKVQIFLSHTYIIIPENVRKILELYDY